jgi:hypothetical protein
MDSGLYEVRPLPDYRLELQFRNGSKAIVNLQGRIKTIRYSPLTSPGLFATARAEGEKVVWRNESGTFSAWCSELLEAMLLD